MSAPDPERLGSSPLFGAIPGAQLDLFAANAGQLSLAPSEVVFKEGDPADALYVVASGRLGVFKATRGGGEKELALLGTDDFFGEMGIIDMQPRAATVRALEPTELWRWDHNALREVQQASLKAYTLLIMNIARELSRRLRRADRMIIAGG